MGEVRIVTSLQPYSLDLVGQPVTDGVGGKVIGKVTEIKHEVGRGGSSTTHIAQIDDKSWDAIRSRMSFGPVGFSFGGKAGIRVLSIWERMRMAVGSFFIRLGKKILV